MVMNLLATYKATFCIKHHGCHKKTTKNHHRFLGTPSFFQKKSFKKNNRFAADPPAQAQPPKPKPSGGVDPDPKSGGAVNASACFAAYDACNFMAMMPYQLTGGAGQAGERKVGCFLF